MEYVRNFDPQQIQHLVDLYMPWILCAIYFIGYFITIRIFNDAKIDADIIVMRMMSWLFSPIIVPVLFGFGIFFGVAYLLFHPKGLLRVITHPALYVVLSFVFVLTVAYMGTTSFTSEPMPTHNYKTLEDWAKDFPEVKPLILELSTDGLTRGDYKTIEAAVEKIKSDALIVELKNKLK